MVDLSVVIVMYSPGDPVLGCRPAAVMPRCGLNLAARLTQEVYARVLSARSRREENPS